MGDIELDDINMDYYCLSDSPDEETNTTNKRDDTYNDPLPKDTCSDVLPKNTPTDIQPENISNNMNTIKIEDEENT